VNGFRVRSDVNRGAVNYAVCCSCLGGILGFSKSRNIYSEWSVRFRLGKSMWQATWKKSCKWDYSTSIYLKVNVAEIKMYRIGAEFDLVVMETRFLFHFHRSVSGSTDCKVLDPRQELSEKDLSLRWNSVYSELPVFLKYLMLPSSGGRMLNYPSNSGIIFLWTVLNCLQT